MNINLHSKWHFHRMVKSLLAVNLIVVLLLLLCTGCKTLAPTAVENALFQITTNVVPLVVHQTNYVPVTNIVVTYVTNEFHQIIEVPKVVISTITNTTTLTNFFESTEWVTRTNVTAAIGQAGKIADIFVPGLGGLGASILTGLLAIWGTARRKNGQIDAISQTAGVLAQTIQVGRELIAKSPQGAGLADAWKAWMIKNQTSEKVIEQVIELLKVSVSRSDASYTADQLLKLMTDVKAGTVPPPPTA